MITFALNYYLKVGLLFFVAYSYISFFDKWNWYILYVLNIVEKGIDK